MSAGPAGGPKEGLRGGPTAGQQTRRGFLKAAGAGAAWVALAGALGCSPTTGKTGRAGQSAGTTTGTADPGEATSSGQAPTSIAGSSAARPEDGSSSWAFRSAPDLDPPVISVTRPAEDVADGYIFVAPKKGAGRDGALMLGNDGEPVWFRPVGVEGESAMDFKAQEYGGEPVITWTEGRIVAGHGLCEYVIADASYKEVARVRAGNGFVGDHHEFLLTDRGTALITIYEEVPADLSSLGGPAEAVVLDSIAQEVDVASGEVVFEWRSLDHVGVEESYGELPEGDLPFDYFHINSIDVEPDGNLIISARRTFAVYKLDRETGEVLWRLGGKRSDFALGEGTRTRYQHDARRRPDGTISLFDNGGVFVNKRSRGVVLKPDTGGMTVSRVRAYDHPDGKVAATQGNMQTLPNGNLFVGWGSEPLFSEFAPGGELLYTARFPSEVESYRAFRFPWTGRPEGGPSVAAENGDEETRVYVSWNGATEVASWEILSGPDADGLRPVGSVPRRGFETIISVLAAGPLVGVQARDSSGGALGEVTTVEV